MCEFAYNLKFFTKCNTICNKKYVIISVKFSRKEKFDGSKEIIYCICLAYAPACLSGVEKRLFFDAVGKAARNKRLFGYADGYG